MDTLSHGLWGGVAFGRKNTKEYLASVAFGMAPDLLSFGVFTIQTILGFATRPTWTSGPPPMSAIPTYVSTLYNVTHSLTVFCVIFAAIWILRKKPYLPMLAWALHIAMDIPTHSRSFFPTPIFWPFLPDLRIDGIPWSRPIIFIPNLIGIAIAYAAWYRSRRTTASKQ